MRGLRKIGAGHRGLRPGLLGALLAAIAVAGLVGCSARAPAAPPAATGTWFQLLSGTLQPLADLAASRPVARAPWTVQSRVADMAFLGNDLYAGINGIGLAVLGRDPQGGLHVTYHPDALIFSHRTLTTLIPREGGVTVHLYYNALLNDTLRQDLSLAGISFVTFSANLNDYAFLVPPFQRKNPDWEAVGLAPESQNSFDVEWKFTDASETRFQYTRFHADTRAEEPEDRDTFLSALGVPSIDGPSVPSGLATFFAACRAQLPAQPAGGALVFSLRSRESPLKRSYRSRKESETATVVPVFDDGGTLLALLPDGRLLSQAPGRSPKVVRLPNLPSGFQYTDLVVWNGSLLLPWEEQAFTDVARAGILVYPWAG